jgi:hypothetical protein
MKRKSRIALAAGVNPAVFMALNAEPTISEDVSPHVALRQLAPGLLHSASNPSRQWEHEKDGPDRVRENYDSAWARWWQAFCRTDDLVAEIIDEFCHYPGWDAHHLHASDVVLDKMGRFVSWYNSKGYWYGWNIGERLEERYNELKSAINDRDAALVEAERAHDRLGEYLNRLTITEFTHERRHSESKIPTIGLVA